MTEKPDHLYETYHTLTINIIIYSYYMIAFTTFFALRLYHDHDKSKLSPQNTQVSTSSWNLYAIVDWLSGQKGHFITSFYYRM